MSDFVHQKGYIYPLPQMTDEERFQYLGKVNEEATFYLDADKFITEQLGDNEYLLWVTSSSYGKESGAFGSCRPCNQQEIYFHAPKFREILGNIDTAKLKFIDFCYYNSTECTTDYYLGEEEYKPMTLNEAIQHCKDVANIQSHTCISEQLKCSAEHQQLAEWLQELAAFKDETPITRGLLEDNFDKINDELYNIHLECDIIDIYIQSEGIFHIIVKNKGSLLCHTIGQLRMFLTLCGLDNLVNEFKA